MGFPKSSRSSTRNHFSMTENRPRMLKDFLLDDYNSCSSRGFNSFPRKPLVLTMSTTLIENDLIKTTARGSDNAKNLRRTNNSKPNSFSNKISALQAAVISAVKSIPFTSAKSPSILPRSLSQKLSKRSSNDKTFTAGSGKENKEEITQVKVKDIIRWTSFRDLVEEESPPLDCTTTSGSSNASSWCDSDFSTTPEYLPPWINNGGDDNNQVKSFSPCVDGDPIEATAKKLLMPKRVLPREKRRSSISCIAQFQ